jgi:CheY-like chemotaxis protein
MLMVGLAYPCLIRIVRLAKAQNITSVADLIAARRALKATDLAEALAAIDASGAEPHGFLVDYHPDGDSGVTVIAELRRRPSRHVPAILMTTDRSAHVREEARSEGMHLLNKPIKPAALRALMTQWQVQRVAAVKQFHHLFQGAGLRDLGAPKKFGDHLAQCAAEQRMILGDHQTIELSLVQRNAPLAAARAARRLNRGRAALGTAASRARSTAPSRETMASSLLAAAEKLQHDLAPVRPFAMLGQVNALPGAELHFAAGDRHVQRHADEHGFDMGRHIVGTLHLVHPAGTCRRDAIERRHQVDADIGVGVLLDHQRSRGMAEKEEQHAIARVGVGEKAHSIACDLDKASSGRLH